MFMDLEARISRVIDDAIDVVNEMLDADAKLRKDPETQLGGLDSLVIVNLIVTVEEKAEQEFGRELSIYDDIELVTGQEILRTVGSLRDHIATRLNEG